MTLTREQYAALCLMALARRLLERSGQIVSLEIEHGQEWRTEKSADKFTIYVPSDVVDEAIETDVQRLGEHCESEMLAWSVLMDRMLKRTA